MLTDADAERRKICGFEAGSDCKRTVKDLKPGQSATVAAVTGQGAVKRRIMDMGIVKGAEIRVMKTAPLGDPIEIFVRGYKLSIRKADADMIIIDN